MLLYTKNIKTKAIQELSIKYKVKDQDLALYYKMIEEGREEEAIDSFIEKYMIKPSYDYNTVIEEFMSIAEQGELEPEQKKIMEKQISLWSYGMSLLLISNFTVLVKKIFAPVIYRERGIKTKKVKDVIIDSTLNQFKSFTSKALTNAQVDILKNVREIQKEMALFNQGKGQILKGAVLKQETNTFLGSLQKKYPGYFKMRNGKLLLSSSLSPEKAVRYYGLEDFVNTTAQTTLLNIDRLATQISVINKEENRALRKGRVPVKVVEYYKRSNRVIKTKERVICKEILSNKKYGKSLLALDQETAKILGIMTLDQAVSTPDYAMGRWCRHSIRPVSVGTRKILENVIKSALKKGA